MRITNHSLAGMKFSRAVLESGKITSNFGIDGRGVSGTAPKMNEYPKKSDHFKGNESSSNH